MVLRPETPPIARYVSRDFVAGSCDAPDQVPSQHSVAHDYAGPCIGQSIRERKALRRAANSPSHPIGENEHVRRMLRTEFNGGLLLGCLFGAAATTVFLALLSPWWAPLIVWMAQR